VPPAPKGHGGDPATVFLRLALGYKSLIADWRHFRLRVFALYGE
jgi:hypothetical protein